MWYVTFTVQTFARQSLQGRPRPGTAKTAANPPTVIFWFAQMFKRYWQVRLRNVNGFIPIPRFWIPIPAEISPCSKRAAHDKTKKKTTRAERLHKYSQFACWNQADFSVLWKRVRIFERGWRNIEYAPFPMCRIELAFYSNPWRNFHDETSHQAYWSVACDLATLE